MNKILILIFLLLPFLSHSQIIDSTYNCDSIVVLKNAMDGHRDTIPYSSQITFLPNRTVHIVQKTGSFIVRPHWNKVVMDTIINGTVRRGFESAINGEYVIFGFRLKNGELQSVGIMKQDYSMVVFLISKRRNNINASCHE